ncbi:hypothetical protein [Nocardia gamkensis]|uniref:Uncharacterized protein n=1 Tax=Nocardia gamkensis TaxID=352869 RepID=A0A7X6R1N5_9NOCA|nr:hypothetical protein [Nocardia gamkensis]NKY25539.1 hypothetical protein [Nocardia gamkensis]NQE69700.1 hypothetical protein [Nocardia gamkensis]
MSKTNRPNYRREAQGKHRQTRHRGEITVRSVKRKTPDLHKLSRAVIALAMAEMDAEKEASQKAHAAESSTDGQMPAADDAASKEVRHDD